MLPDSSETPAKRARVCVYTLLPYNPIHLQNNHVIASFSPQNKTGSQPCSFEQLKMTSLAIRLKEICAVRSVFKKIKTGARMKLK